MNPFAQSCLILFYFCVFVALYFYHKNEADPRIKVWTTTALVFGIVWLLGLTTYHDLLVPAITGVVFLYYGHVLRQEYEHVLSSMNILALSGFAFASVGVLLLYVEPILEPFIYQLLGRS